MEIYTLNRQGQLSQIIERVESFIWTERYSAYGDFELVIRSDATSRNTFKPGVRIVQSLSDRVMTIKTVDDQLTSDGKKLLEIKGYSLESLLQDKLARSANTVAPYHWLFARTPAITIRTAVREIVIDGLTDTKDIIPLLVADETPRPGTIPEFPEIINNDWEIQPLYDAIKPVADAYDLGFSITRNNSTGVLTFRVYTGYDRTSTQTANQAVLFSASLDNLQNTHEIKSNIDQKNVALVWSDQGAPRYVYPTGISSSVSGEDRKVLVVKADNIEGTPTTTEINAWLAQKGREALTKHRMVEAFDGEISQYSPYKYGEDYGLGDLVEYQNEDGGGSVMMVTEQIWALDSQGLRSYPTLTLHVTITPGSWIAWDQVKEWDDLTTEVWNTMP